MPRSIELNPVSFITIGTVGPPGQRTFYLQASKGRALVSLIIEKEHAQALALALDQLVEQLGEPDPEESEAILEAGMELLEPIEPEFRVGQLGLGYDEANDLLVITALELTEAEEIPSMARFWATRAQMRALSRHAAKVCAAGRPICVLCGSPIDPQGHFCPRKDGHQRGMTL
ncbi:MAG: DUF3090 domain-containing protein [Anaerolineae bacterium]